MTVKNFLKKAGQIGGVLIEGVSIGIDKMIEIRTSTNNYGVLNLDEEMLRQLRWMDCNAMDAFLGNRKVQISSDIDTMRQLRWMDDDQLEILRKHM